MTMDEKIQETAEDVSQKIAKFSRDLGFTAPELIPEKYEILINDVYHMIMDLQNEE